MLPTPEMTIEEIKLLFSAIAVMLVALNVAGTKAKVNGTRIGLFSNVFVADTIVTAGARPTLTEMSIVLVEETVPSVAMTLRVTSLDPPLGVNVKS